MEVLEWREGWHLWDLVTYLANAGVFGSGNLFRGQTDAEWGLVPGLYRREVHIFSDSVPKEELYLIAEQRMLDAFFDQAAMLLPNFYRGPLMDRFIAQHYGVPTQLLDWTLDPLIALFFAVHGGHEERNCALFYLNPLRKLGSAARHIDLPWREKIMMVRPPVLDDRVRAQKSVFTLQEFIGPESFTPLDKRILKFSKKGDGTHKDDQVQAIGKVVIPAKHRQQILFQLLQLGIDSSLVYPGLQGIGQRIADIANIQKYGGGQDY